MSNERHLLQLLHEADVPAPEVTIDPQGDVNFEWWSPGRVFEVALSEDGTMICAGLFDDERLVETVTLGDTLPAFMVPAILRAKP